MLTEKAAKLAEQEYRKRRPHQGYPWWAQLLLIPLWWCVIFLAGFALWNLPMRFLNTSAGWAFLGGAAFGVMVFPHLPMRAIYVFGHEMTHWLAAKLTFHETGKIHLGMTKGYVEVMGSSGFIALAPYFVPFYFLLSGCLMAFTAQVWRPTPATFWLGSFGWLGITYAYHVVLTWIALKNGQKDLEYCGKFLSWCIILAGNLIFLFLTLLIASPKPLASLKSIVEAFQVFWNGL